MKRLRAQMVIENKHSLVVRIFFALCLCVTIVGFARTISRRRSGSTDSHMPDQPVARDTHTNLHANEAVTIPAPQSGGQFSISHNVIAGGGGTSSGGTFRVEGTIGDVIASGTSTGSNFAEAGGFWHSITAGPLPTPTPPPIVPTIFGEVGTSRVAAVDSVTLVRGPFPLTDNYNFSSDHRTRVVFFTTDLGFTQNSQPSSSTLSVEIGGFSLPVENVGPITFSGVSASYIVFRLPDLAAGDWPLNIRLNGVASANSPTLSIAASP